VNVARWIGIGVVVATVPTTARAAPDAPPRADLKLTLRVAAGAAYLHESWSPGDGNPGSAQSGWAPALEVAVGRTLSAPLAIGGVWQSASVFSLTESFAGTDYHLTHVVKLWNLVGVYAEDPRLPRIPVRAGIALGLVASSFLDTAQAQTDTSYALAASPYLGYERLAWRRWSLGVLARCTLYRSVFGDTPASATTTGVMPSLMLTVARVRGP
jgi:hypothetical protein